MDDKENKKIPDSDVTVHIDNGIYEITDVGITQIITVPTIDVNGSGIDWSSGNTLTVSAESHGIEYVYDADAGTWRLVNHSDDKEKATVKEESDGLVEW